MFSAATLKSRASTRFHQIHYMVSDNSVNNEKWWLPCWVMSITLICESHMRRCILFWVFSTDTTNYVTKSPDGDIRLPISLWLGNTTAIRGSTKQSPQSNLEMAQELGASIISYKLSYFMQSNNFPRKQFGHVWCISDLLASDGASHLGEPVIQQKQNPHLVAYEATRAQSP